MKCPNSQQPNVRCVNDMIQVEERLHKLRNANPPAPGISGGGQGKGRRGILESLVDGDNALTQPSPGVPGEG